MDKDYTGTNIERPDAKVAGVDAGELKCCIRCDEMKQYCFEPGEHTVLRIGLLNDVMVNLMCLWSLIVYRQCSSQF
jgi:hypothetical protein